MSKTNPKTSGKTTKVIEVEHIEGAAAVLELGAYMNPQAYQLWLPPSKVEYFDLYEMEGFYDGTQKADHPDYDKLYKEMAEFYAGKKIHYGDASRLDEYVDDKYDVIFASHILEHFPWYDTDGVLASWVACLKPGGALHVLVPSLEWVAEETLKNKPSRALLPHLHGGISGPGDAHLCSFTMRYLRARMEKAGLAIMHAVSGPRPIRAMGEDEESDQHYCVGMYLPEGTELPPLQKE